MKKKAFITIIAALMLVMSMIPMVSGCGNKNLPLETEGPVMDAASGNTSAVAGTWQTASMGYEDDETIQPEYYIQFTDSDINYGHMKNGAFVLDHSDKITLFEDTEAGGFRIQAESSNGTQYTYQTSKEDADLLEYYETWNEAEFPEMYRGGASLSRCK